MYGRAQKYETDILTTALRRYLGAQNYLSPEFLLPIIQVLGQKPWLWQPQQTKLVTCSNLPITKTRNVEQQTEEMKLLHWEEGQMRSSDSSSSWALTHTSGLSREGTGKGQMLCLIMLPWLWFSVWLMSVSVLALHDLRSC